jgi:hypothetical protein
LVQAGASLYVLPNVAEEMAADDAGWRRLWQDAGLLEIEVDDFFMGCAAGLTRRYLDYHPDPRDCRVAAEAECAQLDCVLTVSEEFIAGLSGRVEKVRIETPWAAALRHRPAGLPRRS